MVFLLFLLVSLVGYDLCLWLFLDIFYTIFLLNSRITNPYIYNVDPLKPHFYILKLGFTGVYIIFLNSAQKHRL